MEQWKFIEGSDNYEVSNIGNARSTFHGKCHPLKGRLNEKGYVKISIKGKDKFLHRLIASAFIDKPQYRDFINHKDGNKSNNHVDNLEWCTPRENNFHAYENGLIRAIKSMVYSTSGNFLEECDSNGSAYNKYRNLMKPNEFVIIPKKLDTPEYRAMAIDKKLNPKKYRKQRKPVDGRYLIYEQVMLIRRLLKEDEYYPAKIARIFNVDKSIVAGISSGKCYSDMI